MGIVCLHFTYTQSVAIAYRRIERDDSDGIVGQTNRQEFESLLALRDATERHTNHVCGHLLPFCIFIQLTCLKTAKLEF